MKFKIKTLVPTVLPFLKPGYLFLSLLLIPELSLAIKSSESIAWQTIEGGRITFYFEQSRENLAQKLHRQALRDLRRISKDLGVSNPSRYAVFLCRTEDILQSLAPKESGQLPCWAAGVAFKRNRFALLLDPTAKPGPPLDIEKTLPHELCHLVIGGRVHSNLPLYFEEGLCCYEAGQWEYSWEFALITMAFSKNYIPFSEITNSFPPEPKKARYAYAESYHFILFLKDQWGISVIKRIFEEMETGKSFEQAIEEATMSSFFSLEENFRLQLLSNYRIWPIILGGSMGWFMMVLIFFIIYFIKKHRAKRILKTWEEEEILKDYEY